MELKLRRTVIGGDKLDNDFVVIFEGRSIGRIRQASERVGFNPGWDWVINPPLPIPPWGVGSEDSLEGAPRRRSGRPGRSSTLRSRPRASRTGTTSRTRRNADRAYRKAAGGSLPRDGAAKLAGAVGPCSGCTVAGADSRRRRKTSLRWVYPAAFHLQPAPLKIYFQRQFTRNYPEEPR